MEVYKDRCLLDFADAMFDITGAVRNQAELSE